MTCKVHINKINTFLELRYMVENVSTESVTISKYYPWLWSMKVSQLYSSLPIKHPTSVTHTHTQKTLMY